MSAEAAAEATASIPRPAENAELVGHEKAERQLAEAWAADRLGHAWMISGPRGIGKATLAYRLARSVLADEHGGRGTGTLADDLYLAPDHPTFRRVAAGSHADLLAIERSRDEKSGRLRGEIVVNDARRLSAFFALTAGEGKWRVAIVDSADELNRNAANALLKVIEEPPPRALVLLVAHAPGRVLPTIRSRCHKLALRPLDETIIGDLLVRHYPDLKPEERHALARIAEGSAGRAMMLAEEGGLDLYRDLLALLEGLPRLDVAALHAFSERFARADAERAYRTLSGLLEGWVARLVRAAAGAEVVEAIPGEAALLARLSETGGLDQWLEVWEKITRLIASADNVNLDRKQVLITAFTSLEMAGRDSS